MYCKIPIHTIEEYNYIKDYYANLNMWLDFNWSAIKVNIEDNQPMYILILPRDNTRLSFCSIRNHCKYCHVSDCKDLEIIPIHTFMRQQKLDRILNGNK